MILIMKYSQKIGNKINTRNKIYVYKCNNNKEQMEILKI